TKESRCGLEILFIRLAVGDNRQLAAAVAPDQVEEPGCLLLVIVRKCLHPCVELVFRHVIGIEVRLRRLLMRYTFYEGFVVINARPWTIVDVKIVQALTTDYRVVGLEFGFERCIPPQYLPQK